MRLATRVIAVTNSNRLREGRPGGPKIAPGRSSLTQEAEATHPSSSTHTSALPSHSPAPSLQHTSRIEFSTRVDYNQPISYPTFRIALCLGCALSRLAQPLTSLSSAPPTISS